MTTSGTHPSLDAFIEACRACARDCPVPADCVEAIAPLMRDLLLGDRGFLEPRHFRADPAHYARNPVYIAEDGSLSLFALVWTPGQWTPVHDHGTWGVVGVLQGVLEERNYIRTDHGNPRNEGIVLHRGGVILLGEGTVTSFVPNPDHIHVTGVPAGREPVVSLHLYGREMNSFHIYDTAAGTRQLINVPYNES